MNLHSMTLNSAQTTCYCYYCSVCHVVGCRGRWECRDSLEPTAYR